MKAVIAVGSVVCEVESEGGYSPDVLSDMCARVLALAQGITTPEQIAAAVTEAEEPPE